MIIRITDETSGKYVEGKIDDDVCFDKVVELVDGLCIAHGFSSDTVKEFRPDET